MKENFSGCFFPNTVYIRAFTILKMPTVNSVGLLHSTALSI